MSIELDFDLDDLVLDLGAIRNRYGWTQQEFARRLGELTGHQPTGPSISHMERAFCGGRRKRFDAHDIYLLSVVFDVPIVYCSHRLDLTTAQRAIATDWVAALHRYAT